MADRRCLIVGGCGYIGARLAQSLSAECKVTITRRRRSALRDAWIGDSGIRVVDYDSDRDRQLAVAGEFDALINLAMPSAAEAVRDPQAMQKARASAQASVDLLRGGKVGRLLHFSSFHVYGGAGRARFEESELPAPVHPYGQIHLECERLLAKDAEALVIRPSNIVACPAHADLGDQSRLLFLDICRQAAAGAIELNNDGLSYRDFVAFEDVLSAVRILLGYAPGTDRLFNVARGEATRLDDVAEMVASASESPVAVRFGVGQDAFRGPFTISTERLAVLGWKPGARLVDEARRIIRFFS
ncbi:MAG: NAD(P)-dependent oxidoreductase [Pseudomonadota bacterium]|nr:NAD(P)-dependent oxidoreductase [Pseudomonadota bacterium]